jgi:hypothetical protein
MGMRYLRRARHWREIKVILVSGSSSVAAEEEVWIVVRSCG